MSMGEHVKSKLKLLPQILNDEEGNKTGVLLKIKDFEKLIEELEDLHDLRTIYKHQLLGDNVKTIPYEKIREKLFGNAGK